MGLISGVVAVRWPLEKGVGDNWGDELSPAIVELVADRPAVHEKYVFTGVAPVHLVIGSSISSAGPRTMVWGTGFISEKDRPPNALKICAVRGPRTRHKLLSAGRQCPEVYGDTALLLPLFFRPQIKKTGKIGVIRHWREPTYEPLARIASDDLIFIDIRGSLSGVVEEVLSCERIISGSLHGLILAHAYGVPATWVKYSDAPLGDGFKFRDYFESVGFFDVRPLAEQSLTMDDLRGDLVEVAPPMDLGKLIDACPFISEERRALLQQQRKAIYPSVPTVRMLRPAVEAIPPPPPADRIDLVGLSPVAEGTRLPLPLISSSGFSAMTARRARRSSQLEAAWKDWARKASLDWVEQRAELSQKA